jgi:hypothetical protein
MESLSYSELERLRSMWQSPETSVVLQRHMEQYFRHGVIESYLACADASYPESYGARYIKLQVQISRLVRAETYLAATTLTLAGIGNNHYYLERINEETGLSVTGSEDRRNGEVDTLIPVFRDDEFSARKVVVPFTETQAKIVVDNAHELQAMGLYRPLYPIDIRNSV